MFIDMYGILEVLKEGELFDRLGGWSGMWYMVNVIVGGKRFGVIDWGVGIDGGWSGKF